MGISIQPHSRCLNINTGHLDFLQKSGGRGEGTERERDLEVLKVHVVLYT